MKILRATVAPEHAGRKIKYFVRGDMGVSNQQFSSLKMREGLIVNGLAVHANHMLQEGDVVEVRLVESAARAVVGDPTPIQIVYEDDDLYIIDKPAPLACHASDRHAESALENRLAHRFGEGFVFRPVNRLDRGTSGLMAAAKHAHAYQLLQRQLHTNALVREYLAIIEGFPPDSEGTIDLPIAKADEASVRRVVDLQRGKRSVTHYSLAREGVARSMLRLRLETGRTHQIRVHLSHIGNPIVGDFLYGTEDEELPRRFALHSAFLQLDHPLSGERLSFESALPQELESLMK